MKIVSYYCDIENNTYYSDHAKRLKKQCDGLGIESLILERKFGNTWNANCNGKPSFIKDMFLTLKEPFIFVDVDTEVLSIDFEIKGEWGLIYRDEGGVHNFAHYIKQTERNINFINKWIAEIKKGINSEHNCLCELYKELDCFFISKNCFKLGLAENTSNSRLECLRKAENATTKNTLNRV